MNPTEQFFLILIAFFVGAALSAHVSVTLSIATLLVGICLMRVDRRGVRHRAERTCIFASQHGG
jgi:hypothetical protein